MALITKATARGYFRTVDRIADAGGAAIPAIEICAAKSARP